ncbi:MAG: hypothetical protein ACOCX4_02815 [Planctomycetota bacterium]
MSQWRLWVFYWPLALDGCARILANHCQNGALARYPDATREIAIFALAMSFFNFFNATLVFVPQAVNALGRSAQARRVCLRLVLTVAAGLFVLLGSIAYLPAVGRPVLQTAYGIQPHLLDGVLVYLRYLAPLVVIHALRQYCTGLLVQAKRTGWVTVLNAGHIGILLAMLVVGLAAGWPAAGTLATAQIVAGVAHLLAGALATRRTSAPPAANAAAPLSTGEALAFFWPVAATSGMFALSRPILYAFVGRTDQAETTTAAMRVAFDTAMLFHMPMNQFRHLFITFGEENLPQTRRFMLRTLLVLAGGMLVLNGSPAVGEYLGGVLGIGPDLVGPAREALWILCLVPFVATLRNYYHGLAMLRRRTRGMALGGIGRNGALALSAWAFQAAGILDHRTAAVALVAGFLAEALLVRGAVRRTLAADASAPGG